MPATIFGASGEIKLLRNNLNLNDTAKVLQGTDDPTSVAKDAPAGSLYLRTGGTPDFYKKLDPGSSTNWQLISSTSTSSSRNIINLGLNTSVASSALTIDLTQSDGSSDPDSGNPVSVAFRSDTASNGSYSIINQTSALSFTVSNGSTLGHLSGVDSYIYVYLVNNSGTLLLATSSRYLDEGQLYSTTAEGGAGGADSATLLYAASAVSNKAIRLIGILKSNQTTAGVWDANMSEVSVQSFMPYYEEATHNTTFTWDGSGSTSSSVEIQLVRIGSVVHIVIPQIRVNTGTNSALLQSDTDLPTRFRPRAYTNTVRVGYASILDGGAGSALAGVIDIDNTGNIRIQKSNQATFSNSAIAGTNGASAGSYII